MQLRRNLKYKRSPATFQKTNCDFTSIPGFVIEKNSSRGQKHGASERQIMFFKAKEMLKKGKQPKHSGHPTILARWYAQKGCRKSLAEGERARMMEWYAGMMPRGISAARREMGVLQVRWMVARRIVENQGLMKQEVMRDGMKRCMFRNVNGPNEVLDFGKQVGKTLRQVYLEDQGYCDWAMEQVPPSAPKLSQFIHFFRKMSDLTRKNQGICGNASEVERPLMDRVLEM